MTTTPEHDGPEQQGLTGNNRNVKPETGKPDPPRWAMIYMLVLALCLIVWIILDVLHGGPPWTHPW